MQIILKETANLTNALDITELVKQGGFEYSVNSVDSSDSGRNLDSTMMLTRLAWKGKYSVKCVPLTNAQLMQLRTMVKKTFLTVVITYNEGLSTAQTETIQTYTGSTISTAHLRHYENGTDFWENFSFTLIEI